MAAINVMKRCSCIYVFLEWEDKYFRRSLSCQNFNVSKALLSVKLFELVQCQLPMFYRLLKIYPAWNSYIFFYEFKPKFFHCLIGCRIQSVRLATKFFQLHFFKEPW